MKYAILKSAFAFSTALTLSMGIAMPAFAQAGSGAAASAADNDASDIIVTARRVEERLQDVPISISVFNQQQLANRNVVNATDLAAYTPSLSANTNFGAENGSFAIRGFVQDAGTPPSVGVYFADVVAPRGPTQGTQAGDGAGPGNFFDLQNVQVLKGPQGTLQGRNTTGGAVLFVPQKPTSKFEGYVEGSYGNYDMKRVQAMLNVPLSDTARFRIAMDHQERDGYLHNISGIGPKDFNDVNYTAVRASLVVDLTPDLENYTIVSYSRSNTNGSVQKLIACDPSQFSSSGHFNLIGQLSCGQLAREKAEGARFYDVEQAVPNPVSRLEQWQVINTTTWHASDTLTLKNITSYAQFTDKQRSALFGTNWQSSDVAAPLPTVPAIFTDINPIPGRNTADQYTFTEEFQVRGSSADQKLTYQGGIYYESSKPLGLSGNQSQQLITCADVDAFQCTDTLGQPGQPAGAVNYTAGRTSFRDIGLYAQANYALTDTLKLTGGFRYTWDRQTNDSSRITYVFPAPNFPYAVCTDANQTLPSCSEHLSEKSQKPTWLIDLDYKPTNDILLYAKYARGYRAGGVFPNAPSDHRTFGPEKVDSFETGLKTSFHGLVRGTFNVAGFYNNFSNQQLQLGFNTAPGAAASPTTAIINAGKSRIYGVEVEATITPFTGLTVDAAYTYLNATIRKIAEFSTTDANYVAANGSILPGSPLALSPKNKFSITGTYTLPLDQSIGKVSVGATFTHTDKQLTNYVYQPAGSAALYGGNYGYVPSTNLLNLNLGWDSVGGLPIDASLFATNVTNRKYYSFIPGLGGLNGAGAEFAVLGEPRMYGGRLRYHF